MKFTKRTFLLLPPWIAQRRTRVIYWITICEQSGTSLSWIRWWFVVNTLSYLNVFLSTRSIIFFFFYLPLHSHQRQVEGALSPLTPSAPAHTHIVFHFSCPYLSIKVIRIVKLSFWINLQLWGWRHSTTAVLLPHIWSPVVLLSSILLLSPGSCFKSLEKMWILSFENVDTLENADTVFRDAHSIISSTILKKVEQ